MRRHIFTFLMTFAACNHANCGENEAASYARFLDSDAQCWGRESTDSGKDDIAICKVGTERWFCQGEECWPLGKPVRVQRVPEGK